MKKYYYCPHCGEKHIPWNEKFPRRYRGLMCNKFDKGIAIKSHALFWKIFLTVFVCCDIGFFAFLIINRFISLIFVILSIALITFKYNEKVDFVEMELRYLFDENLIDKLRPRINEESYSQLIKDASLVRSFYGL